MKSKRSYTDYIEFVTNEDRAITSLLDTWNQSELTTTEWCSKDAEYRDVNITKLSQLVEELSQNSDYGKDEYNGGYITRNHPLTTKDGNFLLEVLGNCRIKNDIVYEEDLEIEIHITDLRLQEHEKFIEKLKFYDENKSSWNNLFRDKTLDELKSQLLKYKFPKLLK